MIMYLRVSFMGCYSKDCPGNDRERVKEACFYIGKHYHILIKIKECGPIKFHISKHDHIWQ